MDERLAKVAEVCPDCGCGSHMHFADGCHTASGFICRCRATRAALDAGRAEQ